MENGECRMENRGFGFGSLTAKNAKYAKKKLDW
jgi:hypothetical protein